MNACLSNIVLFLLLLKQKFVSDCRQLFLLILILTFFLLNYVNKNHLFCCKQQFCHLYCFIIPMREQYHTLSILDHYFLIPFYYDIHCDCEPFGVHVQVSLEHTWGFLQEWKVQFMGCTHIQLFTIMPNCVLRWFHLSPFLILYMLQTTLSSSILNVVIFLIFCHSNCHK